MLGKNPKPKTQDPHPEAIMTSNRPGSFPMRPQSTSQLYYQCQEKDPAFLRPNMPPASSSRRAQRQNPRVAQNAGQPQGVPRTSNSQTVLRSLPAYPCKAQIHKMTYEQVVSSILQFLGNDPQYMASVDPKQQKSSKRRRNCKVQETTPQVPKMTKNTTQAPHPDNNTDFQGTSVHEQIRPRENVSSCKSPAKTPLSSSTEATTVDSMGQSPHLLCHHHS